MKKKKFIVFLLFGIVLLLFCMVISIALGSRKIPLYEVIRIIWNSSSDEFLKAVVKARIPRTVFGILAGASLGISGVMMQAITRNPIADPSILGINTGASLAVVIGISWFHLSTGQITMWLSFAGAILTAAIVYGIASSGKSDKANPMKLALSGAAVSTALSSMVSTILIPDSQAMKEFRFWQIGSIAGATWHDIRLIAPYLIVGFLLAVYISPALNTLALGDEVATGLGINIAKTRLISTFAGVLLCASTTAIAGPIGFIGLMIPHIVRMVIGNHMKQMVPLSAIYGAVLLLLSDVLGRVFARPGEVEVGIITALIGAPFFIFVIRKARIQNL